MIGVIKIRVADFTCNLREATCLVPIKSISSHACNVCFYNKAISKLLEMIEGENLFSAGAYSKGKIRESLFEERWMI
jgi:hypothetical protein